MAENFKNTAAAKGAKAPGRGAFSRRHAPGGRGLSPARKAAEKMEQESLSVLEKFARSRGLKVSFGKLFYGGVRLRSGQCVFKEEPWLVLERSQPYEEQLELFRKAFDDLKIEALTDDVRSLLYPEGRGLLDIPPEKVAAVADSFAAAAAQAEPA
ncbi:MAG: hypothetical protein LBR80_17855 [Deltaproteobacteria bacterium]|jgi:hypothetical protein|nr:hypothetical protein [Deltaproteobacteria bacterium]